MRTAAFLSAAALTMGLAACGSAAGPAASKAPATTAAASHPTSTTAPPVYSTVLTRAYTSSVAAKTSKISLTFNESSASLSVSGSGAGDFDYTNHRGELKLQMAVMGQNLPIDEVVDGPDLYLGLPPEVVAAIGGKPWVHFASGDPGATALASGGPTQALSLLEAPSTQVTSVGAETIDSVATTHYEAVVDLSHLAGGLPPAVGAALEALGASTANVNLWVDALGRAVRMTDSMTITPPSSASAGGGATTPSPMKVDSTIDFSGWGTAVTVTDPPASEIGSSPIIAGVLGG